MRAYIYTRPGGRNPTKFDVRSAGPDGVADNEDDVGNWAEDDDGARTCCR